MSSSLGCERARCLSVRTRFGSGCFVLLGILAMLLAVAPRLQ